MVQKQLLRQTSRRVQQVSRVGHGAIWAGRRLRRRRLRQLEEELRALGFVKDGGCGEGHWILMDGQGEGVLEGPVLLDRHRGVAVALVLHGRGVLEHADGMGGAWPPLVEQFVELVF